MKLALIGLANRGRTTLLNALAGLSLETQPYPNTEGAPHRAVVKVPDARIDELARIYIPRKTTYATVDYVDFLGLIKGEPPAFAAGEHLLERVGLDLDARDLADRDARRLPRIVEALHLAVAELPVDENLPLCARCRVRPRAVR